MNVKRFIGYFLALTMVTASLTSCSTGTSSSGTVTENSSSTSSSKSTGKPTKLTVSVFDRGNTTAEYGSPTDNKWTTYIKENFAVPNNIDLEYFPIPRQQEVDKLNTLMAAKSAPDISFTYTSDVYYNYAGQGGLTDLTKLVEEVGPNITNNIKEDCLKYGVYDGKLLGIYTRRALLDITGHFIRKDWLDAIGYELKKNADGFYHMSVEDLEKALVQFKEMDLDKTGQEIYAVGMSGSGNQDRSVAGIAESFVDWNGVTEEVLATKNQNQWPGYKNGIEWLNKIYNMGLMDPDYAVQTDVKKMNEYISTGRAGYWTNDTWFEVLKEQTIDVLYKNNPKAEVVAFQLDNVNGKQGNIVYSPTAIIMMVPSFSKSAKEAVMYMNWLSDYENDKVLRYGFEGDHYKLVDGLPVTIDVEYNAKDRITTADLALMYNGDPNIEVQKKAVLSPLPDKIKQIRSDAMNIGIVGGISRFSFGKPVLSSTKYNSNLRSKSAELLVKSIMATPADFSATYDKLVKEFMQIGGQEVMDESIKMYSEIKK